MRTAMTIAPDGSRNAADLRDPTSFDHVGRDAGATFAAGRVLADLADTDPRIVVGCAAKLCVALADGLGGGRRAAL